MTQIVAAVQSGGGGEDSGRLKLAARIGVCLRSEKIGKLFPSLPCFAGRPQSAMQHRVLKVIPRQVLTGELSQRAACEKYHLGWHTLKKNLAHAEPPGYRQSQARPKRKLAPFLPFLQQILEADRQAPKKQRHTAKRIFKRLRDEHASPAA